MKNHVVERRRLAQPYGDLVSDFIAELERLAEGLIDARVKTEHDYEYTELYVVGFRPMTEKELEKAKRERKLARDAKARQKELIEQAERTQLANLLEKYGEDV